MYPDPKLIAHLGEGKLSIMGKPSGAEYLEEDIQYLKKNGITTLVSLLEQNEAYELGLDLEDHVCTNIGIDFHNFPITDRSVPGNDTEFFTSISSSYNAILKGASLVAHCRAGIGRSGIYTTSILIRHGHTVDEAFEIVSDARGIQIPDTQEQIDWVFNNEKSIRNAV